MLHFFLSAILAEMPKFIWAIREKKSRTGTAWETWPRPSLKEWQGNKSQEHVASTAIKLRALLRQIKSQACSDITESVNHFFLSKSFSSRNQILSFLFRWSLPTRRTSRLSRPSRSLRRGCRRPMTPTRRSPWGTPRGRTTCYGQDDWTALEITFEGRTAALWMKVQKRSDC